MQQGGGSPFVGPPPLEIGGAAYPEAAAPISVRQPPASGGFDDLVPQGADEEQGMASCATGNRWPRQETLALLKIRSDMDAAFRDATLKGPLWEEVSKKLAELGYHRSAKKCKEKFENVHKYYKRTKEGRAGRHDGKSYRFFSQLEALQGSSSSSVAPSAAVEISASAPTPMVTGTGAAPANNNAPCGPSPRPQHSPVLSTVPPAVASIPAIPVAAPPPLSSAAAAATIPITAPPPLALVQRLSFSSNTSSYSGTESDNEDQEVEEQGGGERKRKREEGGDGLEDSKDSRKLMAFFEGLMQQVIERQEAMQQRFLEAIERREQDRMIREEAWRRQEISRISREHELAAQERAAAASRDAAIIAFLQKVTGQTIPIPPPPQTTPTGATAVSVAPAAPTQTVAAPPPLLPQPPIAPQAPPSNEIVHIISEPPQLLELPQEPQSARGDGGLSTAIEPASSRWPKSEVHALIKLRSEMETRYQESGPKGPLWEEISAGMGRLGYNRSSKRCKEKWENINKYFKKVKESNKKRPEDAKTCPYFHQLDALYRNKLLCNAAALPGPSEPEFNSAPVQSKLTEHLAVMDTPTRQQGDTGKPEDGGSNGGHPSVFIHEGSSSSMAAPNKPEDIFKKLMVQPHMAEPDSNNIVKDNVEEDDEDDDENDDMQFRIQYQRVGSSGGATGTAGESNFLAMVR